MNDADKVSMAEALPVMRRLVRTILNGSRFVRAMEGINAIRYAYDLDEAGHIAPSAGGGGAISGHG